MSAADRDHGARINELLARLAEIASSADASSPEIRDAQRRISAGAFSLHAARRERERLAEKRSWAESDVHGLERALVLVGDDRDDAGAALLGRRLDTTRARITGLNDEIALVDADVRRIESDLAATRKTLVALLRRTVDDAEKRRLAARARLHETLTYEFDETPMWSPFAVMGYRVWTVREDGLHGMWTRWERPRLDAVCNAGDGVPHTDGRCGTNAFGCGVYAVKSSRPLMHFLLRGETDGFAVGLVGMEGKVVEHERGYRAAGATVLALAVAEHGAVRFIDDPDEIEAAFRRPIELRRLGTVRPLHGGRTPALPHRIYDYFDDQARRRQRWTSENPNGSFT